MIFTHYVDRIYYVLFEYILKKKSRNCSYFLNCDDNLFKKGNRFLVIKKTKMYFDNICLISFSIFIVHYILLWLLPYSKAGSFTYEQIPQTVTVFV